jgi:hypothetical protein
MGGVDPKEMLKVMAKRVIYLHIFTKEHFGNKE